MTPRILLPHASLAAAPLALLLGAACLPVLGCGGGGTTDAEGFTRQSGTLGSRDQSLDSGEYVDEYTLDVQPGQWIEVAMTSSELDPYLILRPPSCPQGGICERQLDNDDFLEGNGAFLWHRADEAGRWSILATSAAPGETGAYALAYRVVPEGGTPATPGVALGGGRTEEGRLEEGDDTLSSGEYVDRHGFVGRAGDRVTVDLRSSELRPYLILQMPDDQQRDNDGWQDATDHARIEATLPADGMYRVLVTTYRPGETGAYTLSMTPGGPGSPDAAGTDGDPFGK